MLPPSRSGSFPQGLVLPGRRTTPTPREGLSVTRSRTSFQAKKLLQHRLECILQSPNPLGAGWGVGGWLGTLLPRGGPVSTCWTHAPVAPRRRKPRRRLPRSREAGLGRSAPPNPHRDNAIVRSRRPPAFIRSLPTARDQAECFRRMNPLDPPFEADSITNALQMKKLKGTVVTCSRPHRKCWSWDPSPLKVK